MTMESLFSSAIISEVLYQRINLKDNNYKLIKQPLGNQLKYIYHMLKQKETLLHLV